MCGKRDYYTEDINEFINSINNSVSNIIVLDTNTYTNVTSFDIFKKEFDKINTIPGELKYDNYHTVLPFEGNGRIYFHRSQN